jgi:hypothetical protein
MRQIMTHIALLWVANVHSLAIAGGAQNNCLSIKRCIALVAALQALAA